MYSEYKRRNMCREIGYYAMEIWLLCRMHEGMHECSCDGVVVVVVVVVVVSVTQIRRRCGAVRSRRGNAMQRVARCVLWCDSV